MADVYASNVMAIAACWKLTRKDGTIMGFTNHDRDLTFLGVTYEAASGFAPGALKSTAGTQVNNLDLKGMFSSARITQSDVMVGKYDGARVELMFVNYNDLPDGTGGKAPLVMETGFFGEISMGEDRFETEFRSLLHIANFHVGQKCSQGCRAILGDAMCGVNLAPFTFTGAVTSVTNNRVFASTDAAIAGKATGYFQFGKITMTSGNNNGYSREVKLFTTGTGVIELNEAFRLAVQIGDTFSIIKGCNHTRQMCHSDFANIARFQGEPYIPGVDEVLKVGA
jgi:uncharacterized phage protein (TIGR02218 family)